MDQLLVKTLLGRIKGSPLDITVVFPIHVTLFSSFAQQIRSLELKCRSSGHVQDLSEAISGPLPLLHTLEIDVRGYLSRGPDSLVAPILPFFGNATNLSRFVLHMSKFPSLRHFTFPNLTTLDFSTETEEFPVSQLLNFLEASPRLQSIKIMIGADLFREDIPPGRVIVLPCVKTFSLEIASYGPGCEVATHISCPFAKQVEFTYLTRYAGNNVPEAVYPPPTAWNMIVHQYAKGTVERVTLEMTVDEYSDITCSITFGSSDRATLKLHYIHYADGKENEMEEISEERLPRIFSQAFQTIRDHPLLANVKHLRIRGGNLLTGNLELVTNAVGRLFGSMESLENLTLGGCDLRPYLDAFLDTPLFPTAIQPTSFPTIKNLAIIDPVQLFHDDNIYAAAIVRLAKSQYTRGVSIERVELCTTALPLVMDELADFVNTVDLYDGTLSDEDEY